MYNCGFGDCFCIEDEYVKRPLYIDFGIHNQSLVGTKKKRYGEIAKDMMYANNHDKKKSDFILTHYHEDHYSGIRNKKKILKFENVYIPDIWKRDTLFLIVLDIIFKRKRKKRGATNILDVLLSIANTQGKLCLVSRGSTIGAGLVALWPDKNYLEKEAGGLIEELNIYRMYEEHLSELNQIVSSLQKRVEELHNQERMQNSTLTYKSKSSLSIREIEAAIKKLEAKIQIPPNYESKIDEFNNEISIVFQNKIEGCNHKKSCYTGKECVRCYYKHWRRNILFTGDVPKKILEKLSKKTDALRMYEKYDVIKIPHHGTENYYFDFSTYVFRGITKCLIPNGTIKIKGHDVCPNYEKLINKAYIYISEHGCVTGWKNPGMIKRVIGSAVKVKL